MHVPFFILFSALFLLHQVGAFDGYVFATMLHNYLDPLLMMPIVLPLIRLERRVFFGRSEQLTTAGVLSLTVSVSFICEGIFPLLSPKCVGDVWDVPCYFCGSFFYLCFMNPALGRAAMPQLQQD